MRWQHGTISLKVDISGSLQWLSRGWSYLLYGKISSIVAHRNMKIKFLGSLLDGSSKQMGLCMLVAVVILLVEYGLYEKLRAVMRGE